jgi:trehalose 6-phosphate synthase
MAEGSREARWAELERLCDRVLANRRLILVSNRGPVEYHAGPSGLVEGRRGSGGVVTALSSLAQLVEFTWIASAIGEGDRRVYETGGGNRIRSPIPGQRIYLRFVVTPRRMYHKYYNVFCNPLVWFLQHYMWNSPYNPNLDANVHDAWDGGYVPVNQAFADAVVEECKDDSNPPIVMVHDYHLYLAPEFIRQRIPGAIINHFTHIPWPSPRYWQLLPTYMLRRICEGMCASNIVGFQTIADVRSFLDTCEEFLTGCDVDYRTRTVTYRGRVTLARVYPISINVEEIRRIANSPRAIDYERRLLPMCRGQTIVRVDRAEPSKNVVRGFKAYSLLLVRHPELHGQVKFLAFLVPSRTHIRQYQRYMEEIQQTIQEINANFGNEEWQPVSAFIENNYTQAIAGMKLYDVMLVNAVIDGMNLVAKEGPVVNTRNGVLILSETTGAHKQLQAGALSVSPADIEGTMQCMYQAITMASEERERRAATLVSVIEREDINHWISSQFIDLGALA